MQEPTPLIPEQRRRALLDALRAETVVSIRRASELLGVSHMTVRRDIADLEQQHLVTSVPGGVRIAAGTVPPAERRERAELELSSKRAIARAAAELVEDGMFVYLDAGTSCQAVVPFLADRRALTIVTSDLFIAVDLLDHPAIRTIHAGGEVDAASGSTEGTLALATVRTLRLDLYLMSTGSWDEDGVTTSTLDKVALKRAVLDASERTVLVADSTKFDAASRYRVVGLGGLDGVITDSGIATRAAELRASGVRLTIAR